MCVRQDLEARVIRAQGVLGRIVERLAGSSAYCRQRVPELRTRQGRPATASPRLGRQRSSLRRLSSAERTCFCCDIPCPIQEVRINLI